MTIPLVSRDILACISVYLCCVSICFGAVNVSGTVRNAEGNVLPHAYIQVRPLAEKHSTEGVVGNSSNSWIPVNISGRFQITLLPGHYLIKAKDEVDGYPDPSFWLNLDPSARFPKVTVEDKEISNVDIVLGRQGGILEGSVRDAITRQPIHGAKIRMQDPSNSYAYVEIFSDRDGRFKYTLPSKPVLISVTAAEYLPSAVENGAQITLSPGEHRNIGILLQHR